MKKLIGNSILSNTSANCFIQCLSTMGTDLIQFCAYNTTTDAQTVCTQSTSGVANLGTLNFDCVL